MTAKFITLAALTAFGIASLPIESAEAQHRLHWREWRVDPDFYFYRPGPAYIPYPYYEFEEDEDYEDVRPRRYSYRPDYYEPEYAPPPRKRRSAVALRSPEPPAKPKAKAKFMSCKKAAGIVSGYGFGAVKATDCKGDTYAFNATRDGKNFAITLNAANGELTKVKKL